MLDYRITELQNYKACNCVIVVILVICHSRDF